jgi:elongation factor G
MAFKICGAMSIKEAAKKASPWLLEPIMKVDVTSPEVSLGDVLGDINRRRGRVLGQDAARGGAQIIHALVPLSEMFGYSTQLRSLSSGRATYTMEPSHFERVPAKIQEEIVKK